jgi:hypothetical protein
MLLTRVFAPTSPFAFGVWPTRLPGNNEESISLEKVTLEVAFHTTNIQWNNTDCLRVCKMSFRQIQSLAQRWYRTGEWWRTIFVETFYRWFNSCKLQQIVRLPILLYFVCVCVCLCVCVNRRILLRALFVCWIKEAQHFDECISSMRAHTHNNSRIVSYTHCMLMHHLNYRS